MRKTFVKALQRGDSLSRFYMSKSRVKIAFGIIVTGLRAQSNKWYHLGLDKVCWPTLFNANDKRECRVFEELFYQLLGRCKSLTPKHEFRFKNPLHSIHATTIDLSISVFPWVKFRKAKGAIKLHCFYGHSGALPSFMVVTNGKVHEAKVMKEK